MLHLNSIIIEDGYEIEFEDSEKIVCNGEHLWTVYEDKNNNLQTIETAQLFTKYQKSSKIYSVPNFIDLAQRAKSIKNIKKLNKKVPMRCITVSNESGLFLCGEKATVTHNSYLSAPYIMTRSILIPNHKSYIMSVTGNQAQETFSKIEDLAMGNIASIAGTTQVFLNEVVKQNAKDSGFTHDKNSHHFTLYNGSEVSTLNSVPKNIVGRNAVLKSIWI